MSIKANLTFSDQLLVVYTSDDGVVSSYSSGDLAWGLTATTLVLFMTYGVGFFYSGLLRRSSALSSQLTITAIVACVAIEWFTFGFSLAFSHGNHFIGNFKYIGLKDVAGQPVENSPHTPLLLQAVYQLSFAVITPAIAFGANAERGSIGGALVLAILWSLIVYNPVAHSIWHPNGFLARLGDIDFAGGGPVHINSGAAAFAYSYYLGQRQGYGKTLNLNYRPASVSFVSLGTVMLFIGWLGFNGGSAGGANLGAVQAMFVTIIGASAGGLTWMLLDYRLQRKFSMIALCSGIVTGLVGITPAAGYVGVPSAMAIGVLATACANLGTRIKSLTKVDDTLDIFAVHAVGGFAGTVLTGIFADSDVAALNGDTVIAGGWVSGHYAQLGYQLASASFVLVYSSIVTLILCTLIDYTPGLRIRVFDDEEKSGLDMTQIGEAFLDLEDLAPASNHHAEMSGDNVHELALQPSMPARINFSQVHEELAEGKNGSRDEF